MVFFFEMIELDILDINFGYFQFNQTKLHEIYMHLIKKKLF